MACAEKNAVITHKRLGVFGKPRRSHLKQRTSKQLLLQVCTASNSSQHWQGGLPDDARRRRVLQSRLCGVPILPQRLASAALLRHCRLPGCTARLRASRPALARAVAPRPASQEQLHHNEWLWHAAAPPRGARQPRILWCSARSPQVPRGLQRTPARGLQHTSAMHCLIPHWPVPAVRAGSRTRQHPLQTPPGGWRCSRRPRCSRAGPPRQGLQQVCAGMWRQTQALQRTAVVSAAALLPHDACLSWHAAAPGSHKPASQDANSPLP